MFKPNIEKVGWKTQKEIQKEIKQTLYEKNELRVMVKVEERAFIAVSEQMALE